MAATTSTTDNATASSTSTTDLGVGKLARSGSLVLPSPLPEVDETQSHVIVVFGSSGDLSKKKTYPALYELYSRNLLPQQSLLIVGYARTEMDRLEFHKRIRPYLKGERVDEFLQYVYYVHGQYDKEEDFGKLAAFIARAESGGGGGGDGGKKKKISNRLFYMALPPEVFPPVATHTRSSVWSDNGWNRVVIEKPFGYDSASCAKLNAQLSSLFHEDQMYRIDHYLGKELVQNLIVLRFANRFLEPVWSASEIANVQIVFKEDIGTDGRGGYFDTSGIIRDVMQNHLMQILTLVAMEPPVSLSSEAIRDEKVKVLKAIEPLSLDDLVIGQYTGANGQPGYLDDATVPKGSRCPTFATAVLHIPNRRWDGVPFILKCGKALNERKAEIRIQFKNVPGRLFHGEARNELVLRVQPSEAIYMKIVQKEPGLSTNLTVSELDLSYGQRFKDASIPDAYARLVYDAMRGDQGLFVRSDEALAAWDIFSPALHQIDAGKVAPLPYPRGSRGPRESDALLERHGFVRTEGYSYPKPSL